MPSPNTESNITGRLPNLSLNPPMTGANRNCMLAYTKVNMPPYLDASLMLPPISSLINLGVTGIMMPNPMQSINRVMNMMIKGKLLFCFILFFRSAKVVFIFWAF